jgi:hypothetical protein
MIRTLLCVALVGVSLPITAHRTHAADLEPRDILTKPGTYHFFDRRMSIVLAETAGKIHCRIKHGHQGFVEAGPIRPLFDKDARWLVYPQSANEVWTFDGRDHLILIVFDKDHPSIVSFYQAGRVGTDGRRLPEKVRSRLPEGFSGKP